MAGKAKKFTVRIKNIDLSVKEDKIEEAVAAEVRQAFKELKKMKQLEQSGRGKSLNR